MKERVRTRACVCIFYGRLRYDDRDAKSQYPCRPVSLSERRSSAR